MTNIQMIVYGSLKFKPFWGRLVIKCSHTLLGFSSASNIIIYFYKVWEKSYSLGLNYMHVLPFWISSSDQFFWLPAPAALRMGSLLAG